MTVRFLIGDIRDQIAAIPDGSVDLVFTSSPFWRLRAYLPADHPLKGREIGTEATPRLHPRRPRRTQRPTGPRPHRRRPRPTRRRTGRTPSPARLVFNR